MKRLLALLVLATSSALANGQSTLTKIEIETGVIPTHSFPTGFGFINTPIFPKHFGVLGNEAFFSAVDPITQLAYLWKSDGTPTGTLQLSSIVVPDTSTLPAVMGGKLYFGGTSLGQSRGLWGTDGTAAGTQLVANFDSATYGVAPLFVTTDGNRLFYADTDSNLGNELFTSDGTLAGTSVIDIAPGSASSTPRYITQLPTPGKVLFVADDGSGIGEELWISDGTPAGTTLLMDINAGPGSSWTGGFVRLTNELIFSADDGVHGSELWATDGTPAGTRLVKDIHAGSGPSWPLTVPQGLYGGLLYIVAYTPALGGELWVTDGTQLGTTLVKELVPGAADADIRFQGAVGGKLLFAATKSVANHGRELYQYDGTAVTLLKDLAPGKKYIDGVAQDAFSSSPTGSAIFGNRMLLSATLPSGDDALWSTDGTASGTVLVTQMEHLAGSGAFELPGSITVLSPSLALYAGATPATGVELHKTDGTPAGSGLVKDLSPGQIPIGTSANGTLVTSGEDLYVSTNYGLPTQQLSCLSGVHGLTEFTPPGSSAVGDNLRTDWLNGEELVTFQVMLDSTSAISELPYRTDGTSAGTVELLTLPNKMLAARVLGSTSAGLFLAADTPQYGNELWLTDGTTGGTHLVRDLALGATPSGNPLPGVTLNDRLLFSASDLTHKRALFSSDGTVAGTQLIMSFDPSWNTAISFLAIHDGRALFMASDGVNGRELWASDGTTAGTVMLGDLTPGAQGSSIGSLVPFAGELYFFSNNSPSTLYRTDGTPQGTLPVPGLQVYGGHLSYTSTVANGLLVLSGGSSSTDLDVWAFDGTSFQLLYDIPTSPMGSAPHDFVACGHMVYFVADEIASGSEVHSLDLTTGLTQLVADLVPGPSGSDPKLLTLANGDLFFRAHDSTLEDEFYRYSFPGAHALELTSDYGFGSGGAQLTATPPILGQSATATISNGPIGSIGILLMSPSPHAPTSALVEAGQLLWVDPLSFSNLSTSLLPSWSVTYAIPNQPSLLGAAVNLQALFLPSLILPVATSNGLRLTLGN